MQEILTVVAAAAFVLFVIKVVREIVTDNRDHRRFIENLRRTQARIDRDATRD